MKHYNLDNFVERIVGEKVFIVDIKQNAIYEVDKNAALCIKLIKEKNGFIDYEFLTKHLEIDSGTLKSEVESLLGVLTEGVSNE